MKAVQSCVDAPLPKRTALASEAVSLLDVVTDPDIISPSARLSELAQG